MEEKKFDNKMYWYHWIAVYALMGSAFAFWAIPEKTLGIGLFIIAVGVGGYLVIAKLPRSEMKDLD